MKTNQQKLGAVVATIMLAATLTACAVATDSGLPAVAAPAVDSYSHDVYFF